MVWSFVENKLLASLNVVWQLIVYFTYLHQTIGYCCRNLYTWNFLERGEGWVGWFTRCRFGDARGEGWGMGEGGGVRLLSKNVEYPLSISMCFSPSFEEWFFSNNDTLCSLRTRLYRKFNAKRLSQALDPADILGFRSSTQHFLTKYSIYKKGHNFWKKWEEIKC